MKRCKAAGRKGREDQLIRRLLLFTSVTSFISSTSSYARGSPRFVLGLNRRLFAASASCFSYSANSSSV